MLTGFLRAFRTPDLRRKLLFTLFIIAIFRLGASLPTPGISEKNVNFCTGLAAQSGGSVYQLVNLFSGGALLKLSVFALGIMPYITAASIILQLLAVVASRGWRRCARRARPGRPRSPSTPGTSPWAWPSCSPPASWPSPGRASSSRASSCQRSLIINDSISSRSPPW